MELLEYLKYMCIYFVFVLIMKFAWSRRKTVVIILRTLNRDVTFCSTALGKMLFGWLYKRITNETCFKSLDKLAKKHPRRTCFFYEEEKWTYQQVQTMSLQVANFFKAQGYRKGDVIGLAMQNRPEVVCIWLGLSRIGVTTALINFNLRGESLDHCVVTAKCKAVIFGLEIRDAFNEIWNARQQSDKPQTHVVLYELDRYLDGLYPISPKSSIPIDTSFSSKIKPGEFKVHDFASCLRTASSKPIQIQRKEDEPHFMDTFLYIFTSGTTGLPKAAQSTHSRLNVLGAGSAMIKLTTRDIAYCPLPLYHTFALSGIVWAIVYGIPLVIVPKFSASKFWSDVHYYKVTACLYMGELCRFIINQPVQEELESNHTLQTMYGCGIKPEVWEAFAKRFKVKRFVEAYGSTEGNCTLVNMEGTKIGAIGYIPLWMQPFYSVTIIKVDEVTGEIIRDDNGFAIACKDNEPGELVGKIVNFFPSLRYDGYTSDEANQKKIARNVFRKGDRYFRSGDIMIRDDHGYFFFKDRIGDTFRWKCENVSTAEVEGVLLRLTGMKTSIVYGVKIPGAEGRAGMAAIYDPDETINLEKLAEGLQKCLPAYAIPVFIRCIRADNVVNMTGTFKLQKFNLQKEGFDIEQVVDPIFVYSPTRKAYQKLEINTFKQIMQGNYRL